MDLPVAVIEIKELQRTLEKETAKVGHINKFLGLSEGLNKEEAS